MIPDPYRISKTVLGHAYAFLGGGTNVQQQPETPLSQQLLQAYAGEAATAQPFLQLSQQYQPAYQDVANQSLQAGLFGTQGQAATPGGSETERVPVYGKEGKNIVGYKNQVIPTPGTPAVAATPGSLQLGTAANTVIRGSNINDVANLGPAAQAAYLQANPWLAGSINQLSSQLNSPLTQGLNTQAAQELGQVNNGLAQISPQEASQVQQETLAGEQQAGLATGGGAIGANLLNQDAYARARAQQYQQFAQGQQQADVSQLAQGSQIFQSTLADPYQTVTGQGSGAGVLGPSGSNQLLGSAGIGAGTAIQNANALFNPYADAATAEYNANAANAAQIANANNAAAQNAGYLGLGAGALQGLGTATAGLALGGVFSDKRLKTDIKKVGKTKEGISIYNFRYKGSKTKFIGPMAQEVEKKHPERVLKDKSGFKKVDFSSGKMPFGFDFVTGQVRRAA